MEIVGVDPGVVHTGLVVFMFDEINRRVYVRHGYLEAVDIPNIRAWIAGQTVGGDVTIFVEDYHQWPGLPIDEYMVQAVGRVKQELPTAKLIRNTGSKLVVRVKLTDLLGVTKFPTATHHADIESAARIALYGMLKDSRMNEMLFRLIDDQLNGIPWKVVHQ